MSETMTKGRAEASSVAPTGGSASGRATAVPTGNPIRLAIPLESVDAHGQWPISAS
jgi:hypothetical protein